MSQRTAVPARTSDRLSYLWLALAAALFLVSTGDRIIWLAAWLAPVFLLRFVRTQRLLPGLLLAWLARSAVAFFTTRGIILIPGPAYFVIVLLLTLLTILPYLADRLITPRLHGYLSTLVFPVAFTAVEYVISFGPNGSFYSIAYTQYGLLPLMQLAAVTGIWGITFLIAWFAAVVNWAWEQKFAWPVVRGGVGAFIAILAVVLLGGAARLALFPAPAAPQVRVAALSASQAAVTAFNQQLPSATLNSLVAGKASRADRAVARTAFAALDDDLLARTRQEARAGAKIVVWPEASPTSGQALQEDEQALIQQAGALAYQEGIYLDMGLAVMLPGGGKGPYIKDEAVLLDPTGKLVWTYEKSHLVPFVEQGQVIQGDGRLPLATTPYGRLANAICYDLDYPGMIRQAGQGRADLLLGLADDWQAIDPIHAQKAALRAIEEGFSLVREANQGLTVAVDYQGHVLGASDYFPAHEQVTLADVPMRSVHTIYAAIGDLFGQLSVLGLAVLAGLAMMQGRRRPSAGNTPISSVARPSSSRSDTTPRAPQTRAQATVLMRS